MPARSSLLESTSCKEESLDLVFVDLGSGDSIQNAVGEVSFRYKSIDVLVNNAGVVNLFIKSAEQAARPVVNLAISANSQEASRACFVITRLLVAVTWFLPKTILAVFTTDTTVITAGIFPLRLIFSALPFVSAHEIITFYFMGISKPIPVIAISLKRKPPPLVAVKDKVLPLFFSFLKFGGFCSTVSPLWGRNPQATCFAGGGSLSRQHIFFIPVILILRLIGLLFQKLLSLLVMVTSMIPPLIYGW